MIYIRIYAFLVRCVGELLITALILISSHETVLQSTQATEVCIYKRYIYAMLHTRVYHQMPLLNKTSERRTRSKLNIMCSSACVKRCAQRHDVPDGRAHYKV